MDFRQSTQPTSSRPAGPAPAPVSSGNKEKPVKKAHTNKWFNVLNLVILLGVAVLVAAISIAVARSGGDAEFKYVTQSNYQAVFLNNGQVYFGNIDNLNDKYVRLTNIYYLTQSSATDSSSASTSSGNYSLVKLGCQQIHDPTDEMLINRDQVTFWENLQNSGKVVTSIKQFQKQNPNGPDCSQVSTQTQASSSTTQGATTTPATTPTSSTTNTTK